MTPVNHFDHGYLGIGDLLLDLRKARLEAKLELTRIGFRGQVFGAPMAQSTGQAVSLVAREPRLLEIFGQTQGVDHDHHFPSA